MNLPVISALYVAALAFVGLALQFHVGRTRAAAKVSLGDGGNPTLLEAMRRQANFVENVPIALLLLVVVDLNGAADSTIHTLGLCLLVARVIHPFGISASGMRLARGLGALLTMVTTLALIVIAVRQAMA